MQMRSGNQWTGGQYSVFRAIFGTYLFVHFAQLAPWGAEMFSNRGMLPDGAASPLLRLFPNVLALYDTPASVTAMLVLAAGASLLFAIGLYDRAAAVALWYVLTCLFGRNPLIANPGLPYVGLLLLAHACLPRAPYGSFERRVQVDPGGEWRMPHEIYLVVWVLMALGYTYSGYTKLISPSWVDGTALERVLDNPLARPGVMRDALLAMPQALLRAATWGTLALELLFAPLAMSRRLRPWLWTAMLAMHLGLIALIDFADLSLGMVMLHLFTFDPGWVKPRRGRVTACSANRSPPVRFCPAICDRASNSDRLEERQGSFCFYTGDAVDNFASPWPTLVQTSNERKPDCDKTNSRDQSGSSRRKHNCGDRNLITAAASICGITPIALQ